MTKTLGSKARRLLIAGSVAIVMGIPTIACMGGADTSTGGDDAKEEPKEDKEEPAKEKSAEEALIGTFKVQPDEAALRELKIIKNAIEGKPPPKKLGDLSASEKKLYQDAKKSSGETQEYFRGLINQMRGARVTFESNGKGRYDFDGGKNPFSYETSNVSGKSLDLKLTYDHGMVEKAKMTLNGDAFDVKFTEPGTATYVFKLE